VPHSPQTKGQHHSVKLTRLVSDAVGVPPRSLLIDPTLDEPVVLHCFEALGKQVERHSGLCLNAVEAIIPHSQLAQDQEFAVLP